MEILFLIGITVFLGTLSGKVCSTLKVPQVTGYILVGLILGKSVLNWWSPGLVQVFTPFTNLALGLIGFMIGSELKLDTFKKRGKSIYAILFSETLMTFFVVGTAIGFLTQKLYIGILFGALAAATAPAATVDVLWENKTRGPLTTTLLTIVALDDVLALLLYGFAVVFPKALIMHESVSWLHAVGSPLAEISESIAVGVFGGYVLFWLIHFIKDRERILPFSLGVIGTTIGVATLLKVDLILSSMILGLTLTNIAPIESKEIINAIKRFSAPIYILFFVLVGARVDFEVFLGTGILVVVGVYVLSRSIGKLSGSALGGFLGGAPQTVTRYLGLCLFSQAGVAIGMAISIHQNFIHLGPEAHEVSTMIVNVIVASTFVFQLYGPICVRFAVGKAGEIGKDVVEEDIIDSYKVSDLIEENVPIIGESTPLDSLVDKIKDSESYDFCVVDQEGKLLGCIALGDLRDVLLGQETELNSLILAKDIAVPVRRTIAADRPLKEAINILHRRDLDFLPVVKDLESRQLIGLIHYKKVMSEVQKELIKRRGSQ